MYTWASLVRLLVVWGSIFSSHHYYCAHPVQRCIATSIPTYILVVRVVASRSKKKRGKYYGLFLPSVGENLFSSMLVIMVGLVLNVFHDDICVCWRSISYCGGRVQGGVRKRYYSASRLTPREFPFLIFFFLPFPVQQQGCCCCCDLHVSAALLLCGFDSGSSIHAD